MQVRTVSASVNHTIQPVSGFSAVQAVTAFGGRYMGGADPRKGGAVVE